MNPLFKLFGINRAFEAFDMNIARYGWAKACKKLTKDLGIRVTLQLEKSYKSKGTLVISNHVTGLDPFLLAGELARDDSYCICDVYQSQKGQLAAKHIIPIYFSSLIEFIYKPITSWPGFFIMRIKAGKIRKGLAKKKNRKSIEKAVKLVKEGKMIIMFPSGGEMAFRPWKKGVGIIALKLSNKEKIYKVEIHGLTELGLIWHFLTGMKYYHMHPINIVGRKVKIESNLLKGTSYEIAQHLKKL